MKGKLCILFFLLSFSLSFSQEKSTVDYYVNYFNLPRETLFLHTNKTTYLPGEEIWFKVYAYDRKSQLTSKATTNIQLSIFDADGKQIDQKLFHAENGFAHGNITVDNSFKTGNYFIKVGTNWMKNFTEDDAFIKKINIINTESKAQKNVISTTEYDIQFLPEGGYLLAGVKNVVGIKAIDDTGKGTRASGVILDQNGKEIASFKSNFLGLGRCSFTPKKGSSYTAKIALENTKELRLPLPDSKERGISIAVNNTQSQDVIIDFNTNEDSFAEVKDQQFQMLIHKDGVTKVIPVKFTALQKRFVIDKQALFKGTNTITLFDTNQNPLVERMFFNESPIQSYEVSVAKLTSEGDSITYGLQANISDLNSINTSISVMPKGTKSYNPKHNILSAFYLKPYLKGHIENPAYYFTKMNRKKRFELDMLLMTQGWSRYSWDRIFNNSPEIRYPFENGITINGSVNNDISLKPKFLIQPSLKNKGRFIEYDTTGRFKIDNFYPLVNEKLQFSLIDEKGKGKQLKMAVNSLMVWEKESIDLTDFQEFQSFYADKNSIPTNFLNENEVLDEVVVSGRLSRVYNKKGPPFKGSVIKITDSVVKIHANIAKILDTEQFFVNQGATVSVRSIRKTSSGAPRPILYFLDGQPIHPSNAYFFFTSPTTQFEDIYVDYSDNYVLWFGRPLREAIIINAFSRISNFESPELNTKTTSTLRGVEHGFEPTKAFYTPRYIAYTIPSFTDFGIIHWEPNVVFTKEATTQLTLIETGLDAIDFYIEGITSDGDLISTKVSSDNSKKN